MTKTDYLAVADVILTARMKHAGGLADVAIREIETELADIFSEDPTFSRSLFISACRPWE